MGPGREKNALCDTARHSKGKASSSAPSSQRFPFPVRRSQDGGEVRKEKELRSWRPRSTSPSTLEGSRQARPFPGLAPPHTGFLKSCSRTWSCHAPGSRASHRPGAGKPASSRPQGRRGDGLRAQARGSGAPRDAVRLETGSPHPRAAVTLARPASSLGERALQREMHLQPQRHSTRTSISG